MPEKDDFQRKTEPFSVDRLERLVRNIEQKHGIVVLYVSECSSRAWGYGTQDSDHDLRFSYLALPWKQNLQDSSCTLRIKVDDIDLQGFDARRTMQMLTVSNLIIFEMMESRLKYLADSRVEQVYRKVMKHYYAPEQLSDAITGLIKRNWLNEGEQVSAKTLILLFRFCLMARSLEQGHYLQTHLDNLNTDTEGSSLMPLALSLRSMSVEAYAGFRYTAEFQAFVRYIDDTLALRIAGRASRQQVGQSMAFANACYRELMEYLHTDVPQLTRVYGEVSEGRECHEQV